MLYDFNDFYQGVGPILMSNAKKPGTCTCHTLTLKVSGRTIYLL